MALRRGDYLKLSVLIPIAIPAVSIAAEVAISLTGLSLPEVLSDWLEIAISGVLYFGIPYVTFVGLELLVLRRRTFEFHAWAAVTAPILFVLWIWPWLWVAGFSGDELLRAWFGYARIALIVGYACVALAFVGLWIGTVFRVITPE